MFDDLNQKQQAPGAPVPPVTPSPTPRPVVAPTQTQKQSQAAPVSPGAPGAEKIYTMPMDYYLGSKTVSATKGSTANIPQQGMSGPSVGGSKNAKKVIVIIILALVVLASVGLLYWSSRPTTPAVQPPVATQPPPAIPPTPPVVVTPPVVEEVVTPPAADTTKPAASAFDPTMIRATSLSLMGSLDTDKDNLTDTEETALGTDPASSDTDKDGYKDGQEVNNFYSPKDSGAVKLNALTMLKSYENTQFGYKFIYPAAWTITDSSPENIIINADQDEFINILVQTKKADQTLEDWYSEQAPSVNRADLKHYSTMVGKISVLESPDGFVAYLAKADKVYILNYSIGLKASANYPAIFGIIINSFEFTQ